MDTTAPPVAATRALIRHGADLYLLYDALDLLTVIHAHADLHVDEPWNESWQPAQTLDVIEDGLRAMLRRALGAEDDRLTYDLAQFMIACGCVQTERARNAEAAKRS